MKEITYWRAYCRFCLYWNYTETNDGKEPIMTCSNCNAPIHYYWELDEERKKREAKNRKKGW